MESRHKQHKDKWLRMGAGSWVFWQSLWVSVSMGIPGSSLFWVGILGTKAQFFLRPHKFTQVRVLFSDTGARCHICNPTIPSLNSPSYNLSRLVGNGRKANGQVAKWFFGAQDHFSLCWGAIWGEPSSASLSFLHQKRILTGRFTRCARSQQLTPRRINSSLLAL